MRISKTRKIRKLITALILVGSFFFIPINTVLAQALYYGNYTKPINGTLNYNDWNFLKADFLNKRGSALLDGSLNLTSGHSISADTLQGKISAAFITPGDFNTSDSSSTGGNFSFPVNLGIGIKVPKHALDVSGNINFTGDLLQDGSAFVTSRWKSNGARIYYNDGNVGIGISAPIKELQVVGEGKFSGVVEGGTPMSNQTNAFTTVEYVDAIFTNPSSTLGFWSRNNIDNSIYYKTGNIGIGTDSPTSLLTLANNKWLSAISGSGTGGVNMFKLNANNQIEVGAPLLIGPLEFASNSGLVSFLDMPITSSSPLGTPHGYVMRLDGNNILTTYAESDGSGGIRNSRVGIGTAMPSAKLEITGETSPTLKLTSSLNPAYNVTLQAIADPNHQMSLSVLGSEILGRYGANTALMTGSLGLGTTNPNSLYKLDVVGGAKFTQVIDGVTPLETQTNALTTVSYVNSALSNPTTAVVGFWKKDGNNISNTNSANVGIGTTNPSAKLQIGPGNTTEPGTVGTLIPAVRIVGANNNITDDTLLRLARDTNSGSLYGSVVDFKVKSYGTLGSPFLPKTQMTIALKAAGGYVENANVDVLTLRDNGNVGIGTTNPVYKLDVAGGAKFTAVVDGVTPLETQTNALTTVSYVNSALSNPTTAIVGFWKKDGNNISNTNSANVGIGKTNPTQKLDVAGNALVSGNVNASTLTISGTGNSSFAGNVGIGTDSPGKTLDIRDTLSSQLRVYGKSSIDTNIHSGEILIGDLYNYQGKIHYGANGADFYIDNTADGDTYNINFRTKTSGTPIDAMTIQGTGNVGIGKTNPGYKLDVAGGAKFTQVVDGVTPLETQTNALTTVSYVNSALSNPTTAIVGFWKKDGNNISNTNSANVGIGKTNPTQKLDVTGNALVSGNVNANTLTVSGEGNSSFAGNVGIGTANPAERLHIFESSTRNVAQMGAYGAFGTTYSGADFIIGSNVKPATSVNEMQTITTHGSFGGRAILMNFSSGITFHSLSGSVDSGGYFSSERMRITNAGNVGIGTTNPGYKLDVAGGAKFTAVVDGVTPLETQTNALTTVSYVNSALSNPTTAIVGFWKKDGNNISNTNSANVGIGKTNPTQKLDVTGNALVSGNVNANTLTVSGEGNSSFVGNVGIGTTNPTYKLDVVGGAKFTQVVDGITPLETQTNALTTVSYVNSALSNPTTAIVGFWKKDGNNISNTNSANVGIGKANPSQKLDVVGNALVSGNVNANTLTISGAGNSSFVGNVGIGTTNPGEKLTITGGNIKLYSQQYAADSYRYIGTEYNNGNGNNKAEIRFAIDGGDTKTRLTFHTANGGGTLNEQMRITSGGNVGIGTTNPLAKIDVASSAGFTRVIKVGSGSSTVGSGSYIEFPSSASDGFGAQIGGVRSTLNTGAGDLVIRTGMNNQQERVRVMDGGNVGIGTTNPTYKLDVAGGAKFTAVVDGVTPLETQTDAFATVGYIASALSNPTMETIGFWTKSTSTNDIYNASGTANIGIGTDSPTSLLTLANNKWLSAISGSGTGGINMFKLNTNNQIEVGAPLLIGPLEFAANSGLVSFLDMPITASSPSGTPHGYAMKLDGNNILTVHAKSDGSGGVNNIGVGIGTASPQYSLDVSGSINFTGGLYMNGGIFQAGKWSSNGARIYYNDGNVGIGTTNPVYKLDVVGGAKFTAVVDGVTPLETQTNALTTVSYVNSALSNPTTAIVGFWKKDGNNIFNTNTANVGIGTTNPGTNKLAIEGGSLSVSGSIKGFGASNYFNGKLGINNNTVGGSSLSVNGNVAIGENYFSNNNAPANGLIVQGRLGVGTSTPAASLHVVENARIDGGLTLGGNLIMTGNTLVVDKITANTIDPLYTIAGVKYSTFASAIVGGVKEEYIGRIAKQQFNKIGNIYQLEIDMKKLNKGSDMWVWYRVIDFSDDNVDVFLSPKGDTASMSAHVEGNKIIIKSDKKVDAYLRLIGKRFDWRKWPTRAIDQTQPGGLFID